MEAKHIDFSYGSQQILFDISLMIPKRKITAILGSNGCGKSTLLQVLSRNLKQNCGEILIDNKAIDNIPMKEYAKKVAIVHQVHKMPIGVTVKQLVMYGRVPYQKFYTSNTTEDEEIVEWAMHAVGISEYKDRALSALSGGQRQRAWIAMALAQKSDYLLLDEPTTYLDVRYQKELLELLVYLNDKIGVTIVMVLHDINQAIKYSDEIICMKNGRKIFQGNTNDEIPKHIMEDVYEMKLDQIEYENKSFFISI